MDLKILIQEEKKKKCADCGVMYPSYIMDFDHVIGEKKFDVSAGALYGLKALKAEIQKCEVVCSNCHRSRTYKRRISEK